MFLRDHYVFFDMTPLDERQDQYLLVGIGDRNPKAVIGESHYNPKTNETTYMPENRVNDQSQNTNGNDPYDSPEYGKGAAIRKELNHELPDGDAVEQAEKWVADHKVEAIVIVTFTIIGIVVLVMICCCYCRHNKYKEPVAGERLGSMMIAHTADESIDLRTGI